MNLCLYRTMDMMGLARSRDGGTNEAGISESRTPAAHPSAMRNPALVLHVQDSDTLVAAAAAGYLSCGGGIHHTWST